MGNRLNASSDIREQLTDMNEPDPLPAVADEPVMQEVEPYVNLDVVARVAAVCQRVSAMRVTDRHDFCNRLIDTVEPAALEIVMKEIRRDSVHAEQIVSAATETIMNTLIEDAFAVYEYPDRAIESHLWQGLALTLIAERNAQKDPVVTTVDTTQQELRKRI